MVDYDFDLGSGSCPITTQSPDAQRWFDRGLAWTYGFNHEEGVVCFRNAAEADPDCAMAYWGEAYASGPFYNMTWDLFSPREAQEATGVCYRAVRNAMARTDATTGVEQALIRAMARRFQADHVVSAETFRAWDDAYADAMRDVYAEFPEDLDVIALFVEAMVTRTPWKLWDVDKGEPARGADTVEAIAVLESGLQLSADRGEAPHIGILHMYVHTLEMSPAPERALPAADALRDRSPDNGHLQHMPAHIYVLCGHYSDALAVSEQAILADKKYLEYAGAYNFYTTARCHDLHMKMQAAMLAGLYQPARQAAEAVVDGLPEDLLRTDKPLMAMILEGYYSVTVHVPVRFGQWQQIIDAPLPDDPQLYCVTIVMSHYAKAVAYAATGDISRAEIEQSRFGESLLRVPQDRLQANNLASEVLAIAAQMLEGELAYRKGNFDIAFDHLRDAVRLDDNLSYSEPWPWMHPPRHALGALLLEQARVAEAERVYRADLGLDATLSRCRQHPDNVWSLHGYVECLRRRGAQRELPALEQRLALALARADVPINASCCCRTKTCCD